MNLYNLGIVPTLSLLNILLSSKHTFCFLQSAVNLLFKGWEEKKIQILIIWYTTYLLYIYLTKEAMNYLCVSLLRFQSFVGQVGIFLEVVNGKY